MALERMDAWIEAKKQLPSDLQEQDGDWYRGLGFVTLGLKMNFFILIVSNTPRNEFRLGIYVTPSLSYAKDIAGRAMAAMVFKDINEQDLDLWEPSAEGWKKPRRALSDPIVSEYLYTNEVQKCRYHLWADFATAMVCFGC